MSFEDDYYRPQQLQYRDRTLTKSESMSRKTYGENQRYQNKFFEPLTPPFPNNHAEYFESSYFYYKTDMIDTNGYNPRLPKTNFFERPRTLSFSEVHEPFHKRRSIRERNRRRQSYNPSVYESSSSDSDCISVGSADIDWRRRKRLSRLTGSNTSIRSEMVKKSTNPFLKPGFTTKIMGKSPPPSNSILSGLSPTSVARCRKSSNSTSSDSSL